MTEFLRLNDKQIEYVYNNFMKKDFPPDELKPLSFIKKAINENIYTCYGLFCERIITGYLFLEKLKDTDDYLVDYLAVVPEYRNKGLGSEILKLLIEKLPDAKSILVEVEDPDYAENEDDRILQTRRYGFYIRNGFKDTSLRAKCYGVPFRIIETGKNLMHTKEETEKLYRMHYKAMWPRKMYETKLFTF